MSAPALLKKSKTSSKTKTNWPFDERSVARMFVPILVVALVAISSFLLGHGAHSTTEKVATSTKMTPAASAQSETTNAQDSAATNSVSTTATSNASTTDASASSVTPNGVVDINTASVTQLETLNGIGPTKAQAIIDYRNQIGTFTSVDQLENVSGIGPKTLDKLRSQISL